MATTEPDLKSEILLSLLRVLNKVQADSRFARTYGDDVELTMVEAEIVALVSGGYTTATQITDELDVTPSAVSQTVRRLTTKDVLTATRDPDNARRKQLALTPTGRAAARAITEHYERLTNTLLDVPTRDLRSYRRFITQLEEFLDLHRAR